MADLFIDNMVRKCIRDIIENRDTLPDNVAIWKSMTRMMFKNFPAAEVWGWMQTSLEEASDEQWFEKKYPRGFFKESFIYPKRKTVINLNSRSKKVRKIIDENLKITEVAKGYGLKLKGKANKTLCPFHEDKDPSLTFSDEKNVFNCFGCSAKGDIIKFIGMMEDEKRRS